MLKYDIYHYLSCVHDEIISVIAGDVISFRQKRFYVVIILTANCNNKVKITVTTWLQNDTALLPFTSANRGMHICFLQYINKILPGGKSIWTSLFWMPKYCPSTGALFSRCTTYVSLHTKYHKVDKYMKYRYGFLDSRTYSEKQCQQISFLFFFFFAKYRVSFFIHSLETNNVIQIHI